MRRRQFKETITTLWPLLLLVVLAVLIRAVSTPAQQSQSASAVQQTATMANATTKIAVGNAASGSQSTATLTPSGSNSVYITLIDLEACTSAAPTAQTNVTWTSTGITGAPVWQLSIPATADYCTPIRIDLPATPLKSSTPGTAVTIVSPAGATSIQYTGIVYWYEAP